MERRRLTDFDEYPRAMRIYMRNYGPHFNRKLCDFATSLMTVIQNGKEVPLKPITKEEAETILQTHNIKLENNQLYDFVYTINMAASDYLGSSIPDEQHLAYYVKDVIDDVDAVDGLLFNRFYADTCYKGIAIDWEEVL